MSSPYVFPVAWGAGAAVLILLAGLPPIFARVRTPATAAEAVASGVRWLALFVTLTVLVPAHSKVFDDFGAILPFLTEVVIRVSDSAAIWMPGLLLLGVAETALFHRLYREPARRPLAKGLSWLSTAAAVVAVAGVVIGLLLPLIKIGNDLS